eukprot:scaffold2516_cov108-Isochrysis_galbana.AAC.15
MWSILIGLAALCRPRVVFTDCDGTLLRPDHTLSDRARQTLRALDRAGVIVVPATGRGRAGTWTSSVLTELRGGAPGVFCNGCTSFDRDGTALPPALLPTSLPASVLGALGTSAVGAGCVAVAYVGDEALYEYSASALILRLAAVGDSPLRRVECLRSACAASPVSKILLLHDAHALPALRAAVAPVVGGASGGAVTQAIDWMLEVVPSHADKGSAAGELLARWGLGCADVPVENREGLLPTTKRLPPPGAWSPRQRAQSNHFRGRLCRASPAGHRADPIDKYTHSRLVSLSRSSTSPSPLWCIPSCQVGARPRDWRRRERPAHAPAGGGQCGHGQRGGGRAAGGDACGGFKCRRRVGGRDGGVCARSGGELEPLVLLRLPRRHACGARALQRRHCHIAIFASRYCFAREPNRWPNLMIYVLAQ